MVGKLYNHILLLLGVLLFAFYLTTTSYAAINEQLTFYGTLQNSSGSNLSGTYDMVFRFYDAPTGGTLLDTSTHTAGNGNPVTVSNGEFTVQLGSGSGNALDGIDFNTTAIYVGLSVDADPEMTPRERLSAAAYAFNADRLDGYDATDFLRTNATGSITVTDPDTLLTITQNGTGDLLNLFDGGTEVFSILDGGNVGIGTSAPAYQLSVAGDMQLTGALYDSTNSAGPSGYVLQSTGSGLEWVATSSLGIIAGGGPIFTDGGATTYLTNISYNVLIGDSSAGLTNLNSNLALFSIEPTSQGVALSTDGTKLFVVGSTNDAVIELDLLTPYDVSTASATGQTIAVPDTSPASIVFNPTGTIMLVLGGVTDTIYEYSLSVGYDLSTATSTGTTFLVSPTELSPHGLALNNDGSQMFVLGLSSDTVYTYDLLTPYDISTASLTPATLLVNGQETAPLDLDFNADGTRLYVVGSVSDTIYTYTVSTPYDVSTAVYNGVNTSLSGIEPIPSSLYFSSATERLYVGGNNSDQLRTFDASGAPQQRLALKNGGVDLVGSSSIRFGGTQFFSASTTNNSTLIGELAGANLGALASSTTLIGFEAGRYASTSGHANHTFIGYQAGRNIGANATGTSVAVGHQAGLTLNGADNTIMGTRAGYANTGNMNVLMGTEAGYSNSGHFNNFLNYRAGANNTGQHNIAIGIHSGEFNTGDFNIFFASSSGRYNTSDNTIALGQYAGENNSADNSIFMGQYAGQNNIGLNNVFLGRYAGQNNEGSDNVIIGYHAGRYLSGTSSAIIGTYAFEGTGAYDAVNNVALGFGAGRSAQTGADNNILLGYQAADNLTTGSNNIVIGYDLDLQDPTQNNTLTIGNVIFGTGLTATGTDISTGSIGIGTSSPSAQLTTTGSVRLANFGAGTLQTDASGNVSVSSDERLKNVVENFNDGLASILGIEPIVYKWNNESGFETETEYIGFSAQNVQDNIPGAVGKDKHGFLTLSDRGILASVVNAIKELWSTLTDTQDTHVSVTERIATLELQISKNDLQLAHLKGRIEILSAATNTTQGSSGGSDTVTSSGNTEQDSQTTDLQGTGTTKASSASTTSTSSTSEGTETASSTATEQTEMSSSTPHSNEESTAVEATTTPETNTSETVDESDTDTIDESQQSDAEPVEEITAETVNDATEDGEAESETTVEEEVVEESQPQAESAPEIEPEITPEPEV